jgi:hypothetical protein
MKIASNLLKIEERASFFPNTHTQNFSLLNNEIYYWKDYCNFLSSSAAAESAKEDKHCLKREKAKKIRRRKDDEGCNFLCIINCFASSTHH